MTSLGKGIYQALTRAHLKALKRALLSLENGKDETIFIIFRLGKAISTRKKQKWQPPAKTHKVARKKKTKKMATIPRKEKTGKNAVGKTGRARAGSSRGGKSNGMDKAMPGGNKMCGKKEGGHGRVNGLRTGQTGPGKTSTRMHGLMTTATRRKKRCGQNQKEPQAAAEPQAAFCRGRGWPK